LHSNSRQRQIIFHAVGGQAGTMNNAGSARTPLVVPKRERETQREQKRKTSYLFLANARELNNKISQKRTLLLVYTTQLNCLAPRRIEFFAS